MSDLTNLTCKQVDLSQETLFIGRQKKTGVGVAIPIHQDLLEFLKDRSIEKPNDSPSKLASP